MISIIPSILTNDPQEARDMVSQCEGVVERVSVDIIDGKYADNKTVDPSTFFDVDTSLKIDFQLMVKEPINWIEKCAHAGADRIIGHIEYMSSQVDFVGKVQEVGNYVGLGLDLDTPISKIDPTILTNLDIVLLMSVPAGFGGQKFRDKVIKKIKRLREIKEKDETPFKIHLDGGVNSDNIKRIVKAGADEASVGRLLFKGNLRENIEKLKDKVGNL